MEENKLYEIKYDIIDDAVASCIINTKEEYIKELVIPDTTIINHKKYKVTILHMCFINHHVDIDNIKIGKNLTSIMHPIDLVRIKNLEIDKDNNYLYLENGVLYDRNKTFIYFMLDQNVSSLKISEGVIGIDDYAFHSNHYLKEIYLPKSLKKLGDGAFYKCINLEKIVLQEGLKEIGCHCFWCNNSLKELKIPSSVTKMYIPGSYPDPTMVVYPNRKNNFSFHDNAIYDNVLSKLMYVTKGDIYLYSVTEETKILASYSLPPSIHCLSVNYDTTMVEPEVFTNKLLKD